VRRSIAFSPSRVSGEALSASSALPAFDYQRWDAFKRSRNFAPRRRTRTQAPRGYATLQDQLAALLSAYLASRKASSRQVPTGVPLPLCGGEAREAAAALRGTGAQPRPSRDLTLLALLDRLCAMLTRCPMIVTDPPVPAQTGQPWAGSVAVSVKAARGQAWGRLA